MRVNRRKYRQSMDAAPVTAWTKIRNAADPTLAESRECLHQLIEVYDRPLGSLFEAVVDDPHTAADWKQDFVVSHLLSGRLFSNAKPKGRFRSYLATAVKNFVINQHEKRNALKRKPSAGANPFSCLSGSDSDDSTFEERVSDRSDVDAYEKLLARVRAFDMFNQAYDTAADWCREQTDAELMLSDLERLRTGERKFSKRSVSSDLTQRVDAKVAEALRAAVWAETYVAPGQSKSAAIGEEIARLRDALGRDQGGVKSR